MKFLPFLLILLSFSGICYGMSSQGAPQYLMGIDHGHKGWANPCGVYSSGISRMQCNTGYAQGLRSRPVSVSRYVQPTYIAPQLGVPQQIYSAAQVQAYNTAQAQAAYENQMGTYTGLPVLQPTV